MKRQLPRIDGWRSALNGYISESRRRPMDLGTFDCGLFPAGCIEAMTGFDHAQDLRGKYTTYSEAKKALKKYGFATHEAMAAALFEEIHPSAASIGDLASFTTDDEWGVALGVVNGETCFVMRPDGLGVFETLKARRAFRI